MSLRHTLEQRDFNVANFVYDNITSVSDAVVADLKHVENCINFLIDELSGFPVDDEFIKSLARKDLYNALLIADKINQRYIIVYVRFLYNYVPSSCFKN